MTNHRLAAGALLAATALTFAAPASAQRVDRIVAFGDSYADDGNFFAAGRASTAATSALSDRPLFGRHQLYRHAGATARRADRQFRHRRRADQQSQHQHRPVARLPDRIYIFLAGGGPAAFPRVSGTFDANDLLAVSIGGNDARIYQTGNPRSACRWHAGRRPGGRDGLGGVRDDRPQRAGQCRRAEHQLPRRQHRASCPKSPANPAAQAIRNAFSTTFNTAIQATLAGYAANGVIVHYLDLTLVGQQHHRRSRRFRPDQRRLPGAARHQLHHQHRPRQQLPVLRRPAASDLGRFRDRRALHRDRS